MCQPSTILHGNLDETIFMVQPLGFIGLAYPYYVYHLKKAIYGLKQVPHA